MTKPVPAIHDLPALPRDEQGPVFREPWEAQAFALAVTLSQAGHFSWPEWADTLSQEIQAAQKKGDPGLGTTYYQHWLNALERLCAEKELVTPSVQEQRKEEWRLAYLNTPHGQSIELAAAKKSQE